MKLKHLVKKMSFKELLTTVREKGWFLPEYVDLIGVKLDYDYVWVVDLVSDSEYTEEDKKYGVKLAYVFDVENQKKVIVNQKFIENCVVFKEI